MSLIFVVEILRGMRQLDREVSGNICVPEVVKSHRPHENEQSIMTTSLNYILNPISNKLINIQSHLGLWCTKPN